MIFLSVKIPDEISERVPEKKIYWERTRVNPKRNFWKNLRCKKLFPRKNLIEFQEIIKRYKNLEEF